MSAKRKFVQAEYDRWRKTIPFTNEQIAKAMEDLAAPLDDPFIKKQYLYGAMLARKGFLSAKTFRIAIPALVKVCNVWVAPKVICGKVALYRFGCEGRCKAHKHVVPEFMHTYRARKAAQGEDIEDKWKRLDRADKKDPKSFTKNGFRSRMTNERNILLT